MKNINIITTKIYLFSALFLFSVIQQSHAMEEKEQDDGFLPITVNLENDREEIVYSSQWNLSQLDYVGTLYNQYEFEPGAPLNLQESQISKKQLKTIEKSAMLLAILEQEDPKKQVKKQKNQLKKCLTHAKQSDHATIELMNGANFLSCSPLLDACAHQLYQRAKSLSLDDKSDQAVALLESITVPELSMAIGNHFLNNSRHLKQLLACISDTFKKIELRGETISLCYSPEGKSLACIQNTGLVKLLLNDTDSYQITPSQTSIVSIIFSDENKIHYCQYPYSLLWTFDCNEKFPCHKNIIKTTRVIPHLLHIPEKKALCIFGENKISIWNLPNETTENSEELTAILEEYTHTKNIRAVAADPKKNCLFLGCVGSIDILEIDKPRLSKTFLSNFATTSLCLSKDRKTLFSGNEQAQISFWNIDKKTIFKTIECNPAIQYHGMPPPIRHLRLSPDGTMLAVSFANPSPIQLIDTQDGYCIKIFLNNSQYYIDFAPDGKTLAAKGFGGVILNNLYNEELYKKLHRLPTEHIAVLDYCAQRALNNQPIELSEKSQRLFDELPEEIKSGITKINQFRQEGSYK